MMENTDAGLVRDLRRIRESKPIPSRSPCLPPAISTGRWSASGRLSPRLFASLGRIVEACASARQEPTRCLGPGCGRAAPGTVAAGAPLPQLRGRVGAPPRRDWLSPTARPQDTKLLNASSAGAHLLHRQLPTPQVRRQIKGAVQVAPAAGADLCGQVDGQRADTGVLFGHARVANARRWLINSAWRAAWRRVQGYNPGTP
jgi:hypothetical protein